MTPASILTTLARELQTSKSKDVLTLATKLLKDAPQHVVIATHRALYKALPDGKSLVTWCGRKSVTNEDVQKLIARAGVLVSREAA